jgi:hypothetical protein
VCGSELEWQGSLIRWIWLPMQYCSIVKCLHANYKYKECTLITFKKDLFGVMARYLGLSLCKIVRSSVILLLPLFIETVICILLHFNAFGKIFYEAYLRALSTSPNYPHRPLNWLIYSNMVVLGLTWFLSGNNCLW